MIFKTAKFPDLPELIESLSTSDSLRLTDDDVEKLRFFVHSDGCTKVPNFRKKQCHKHDFMYRTHVDFSGHVIRRKDADRLYRLGMQSESRLGVLDPLSWWRWLGVRLLGARAWYGD